jgi:hypothetical protein
MACTTCTKEKVLCALQQLIMKDFYETDRMEYLYVAFKKLAEFVECYTLNMSDDQEISFSVRNTGDIDWVLTRDPGPNQVGTIELAPIITAASFIQSIADTASVDLTVSFGGQLSAVVLPAGVNHNLLMNYVANEHVDHSTVSIIAGTGLTGGGDITASRTLNLADTAVIPNTYGDATNVAQFTVDQQGRITFAGNVPITFPTDYITSVANTTYINLSVVGGQLTATLDTVDLGTYLDGIYWKLDGNTVGTEKWLGTIDSVGISFRSNSTERLRFDADGRTKSTVTRTATGNSDYAFNFTGTHTARATASDVLFGVYFNPTLVASAATQQLRAVSIIPTFTPGAFSPQMQALFVEGRVFIREAGAGNTTSTVPLTIRSVSTGSSTLLRLEGEDSAGRIQIFNASTGYSTGFQIGLSGVDAIVSNENTAGIIFRATGNAGGYLTQNLDWQFGWQGSAAATLGRVHIKGRASLNLFYIEDNTSVARLVINTAGRLTSTVTYTGTATNDYGWNFTGTLTNTSTASHIMRGILFNPTLVAGANSQTLTGVTLAAAFTNGAFTNVLNYHLRAIGSTTDCVITSKGNIDLMDTINDATNSDAYVRIRANTANSSTNAGRFEIYRGITSAGGALLASYLIGEIRFYGSYDGSNNFGVGAKIKVVAGQGFSAAGYGSTIIFETDNNTTSTARVWIDRNGTTSFGAEAPAGGNRIYVQGGGNTAGSYAARFDNSSSHQMHRIENNGTFHYAGTSYEFYVQNNGTVTGTNGGNEAVYKMNNIHAAVSSATTRGSYRFATSFSIAHTSDYYTHFVLNASGGFIPSSGSGTMRMVFIQTAINQTGTASGNFIGIDYDVTETAVLGVHYAALFRRGRVGFNLGATLPTANFHLGAGTTTLAFLKLTMGSALTTIAGNVQDGALEYVTNCLYLIDNSTRYMIPKMLSNSATLDFPSTAAQTHSDLTITVTGAALNDEVLLGVPNGSVNNDSCFTAFVSATDTVTVRFNNYSAGAIDPASGTFKVSVIKR